MTTTDAGVMALRERLGRARLLLVFDGHCGICTRTAEWVRARDPAGNVLALPSQTPNILAIAGLTRTQADAAAWTIDRAGRRRSGAAAISRTLGELRPGWCRAAARLYGLPGLGWCEDRGYAWFARNRGRFARWGAVPACERDGAACEPE